MPFLTSVRVDTRTIDHFILHGDLSPEVLVMHPGLLQELLDGLSDDYPVLKRMIQDRKRELECS